MGTLLKVGLALCVGLALVGGVHRLWLSGMADRVDVQSRQPAIPQTPSIPAMSTADAEKLRNSLVQKIPAIDTASGQRAGIIGLSQRIDTQNRNALSHVPLPNGSFGH